MSIIIYGAGRGVDEVAAIAVDAEPFMEEAPTFLCFILAILQLVIFELVESMCEFALVLIGAAAILYKFLAELGFLLIPPAHAGAWGLLG